MKIRRLTAAVCAVLLTVSLLTACGQEIDPVPGGTGNTVTETVPAASTDIREVAAALNEGCTFSEPLTQNDAYLSKKFPQLDGKYTDCTAYAPAGIVPEEIFIFKASSADCMPDIVSVLEAYAAQQAEDYADYAPAQVPKLDNYVLYATTDSVIYIVSCDNAGALNVVESMFGRG